MRFERSDSMPPGPFPVDRKEFFRERKHERSESPFISSPRWRDSFSPYPSPHHMSRDRFGSSEFRRPHGRGKQGGWPLFAARPGRGYGSPRHIEKPFDDENYRPLVRYSRNCRPNRGSFSQRDSRIQYSEVSNGFSRTWRRNDDQTPVNNKAPSHLNSQTDVANTWDQSHPKPLHNIRAASTNGLQHCVKENSLASKDWKPLKWTRPGNFSSCGSGLNQSSRAKSLGVVESSEMKLVSLPKMANAVESPSGDAITCVTTVAQSEMTPKKKPRLGWGEGLAKYEKKKVVDPDANANIDGTSHSTVTTEGEHSISDMAYKSLADPDPNTNINGANSTATTEEMHLNSDMVDKSLFVIASDYASPEIPSSFTGSSSPGVQGKSCDKSVNVDSCASNLCLSQGPQSHYDLKGFPFKLEDFDMNSINVGFLINELLQLADPGSVNTISTAIDKLSVLKSHISMALEIAESEADMLENELKLLKPKAKRSSPPLESNASRFNEQNVGSGVIPQHVPLRVGSVDTVPQQLTVYTTSLQPIYLDGKDEDISSRGSATSKFVERLPSMKDISSSGSDIDVEYIAATEICGYTEPVCYSDEEESRVLVPGEKGLPANGTSSIVTNDALCKEIFLSNKEVARKAVEAFNELLPSELCHADRSGPFTVSSWQGDPGIERKFRMKKQFLRSKVRLLTLKYRALQYLWKEDVQRLSVRKHRAKAQKRYESSLQTANGGCRKYRSSIVSRSSSRAGSSSSSSRKMIKFTSKLLSNNQCMTYRDKLKMPALILDEKDNMFSRFVNSNGLVEDPIAVEKERAMINPWTLEEREIFMEKFAIYNKDFKKISSFLDHRTTADCVEFYYKNHKSDCFQKTKSKLDLSNLENSSANTYVSKSGKNWNRNIDAASLDILGEVTEMASRELSSGGLLPRGHDSRVGKSGRFNLRGNKREILAVDALENICGSTSSRIISSSDQKDFRDSQSHDRDFAGNVADDGDGDDDGGDDTSSDGNCEEMVPGEWTDKEKSNFVQALSNNGKNFSIISRHVGTKSEGQCKVFFSKTRKCLGLDQIHPPSDITMRVSSDDDENGNRKHGCHLESKSIMCKNNVDGVLHDDDLLRPSNVKSDVCRSGDFENILLSAFSRYPEQQKQVLPDEACGPSIAVQSNPMRGRKICQPSVKDKSMIFCDSIASPQTSIELDDVENLAAMKARPCRHAASFIEENSNQGKCSSLLTRKKGRMTHKSNEGVDQDHKISADSAADLINSSRDITNWPLQVPAKKGNRDIISLQPAVDLSRDFGLHSCNSSKANHSAPRHPSLTGKEQTSDHLRHRSWSSSDTEKQPSADALKVIGKMVATDEKNKVIGKMVATDEKKNKKTKHTRRRNWSGNPTIVNSDLTNHPSLETLSIRPYRFRDRNNTIQAGFTTLPESVIMEHFGIYSISRDEHQAVEQAMVKINENDLNHNSVFSLKDMVVNNGVQPFQVNMEEQPGMVSQPKQNWFEALPDVKQYDRRMTGTNVVGTGGILHGGSYSLEQQPVQQAMVMTEEQNLNRSSLFSAKNVTFNNVVQPFGVNRGERAGMVTIPKRNRFEAPPNFQQHDRRIAGSTVVGTGGILLGGSCSGVSDSLAGFNMNRFKADQ